LSVTKKRWGGEKNLGQKRGCKKEKSRQIKRVGFCPGGSHQAAKKKKTKLKRRKDSQDETKGPGEGKKEVHGPRKQAPSRERGRNMEEKSLEGVEKNYRGEPVKKKETFSGEKKKKKPKRFPAKKGRESDQLL